MPRQLDEQVIVITGGSSGIGRETAREVGRRGARVVLAARNAPALQTAAREVEQAGGQAHAVVTDVADWSQVESLAREAVDRFGRIDTWVNNAAITEIGLVERHTVEEIERIIQVNLLGAIYGTKAALSHMRRQSEGTIINVGSVESLRAVPLQAAYVAAKQGLKGFTDTLRMELKHEGIPVHVVLILPCSINTPLFSHARSRLGVRPHPIPPIYEPRVVAEAIAFAAEHPQREIVIGGPGKALALMERISPALVDWYMVQGGRMFKNQWTDRPDDGRDNLFGPVDGPGSIRGEFGHESLPTSLYTRYLELRPRLRAAVAGLAVLGMLGLTRWRDRG